jgi:hypothetical protein
MKSLPLLTTAIAGSIIFMTPTLNAATIVAERLGFLSGRIESTNTGAGGTNFDAKGGATISVFDGNAFLQGNAGMPVPLRVSATGTHGLDPISDYAFYNGSNNTGYAAGASSIISSTFSAGGDTRETTALFTTNDPGAAVPIANFNNKQKSMASGTTFSIDLSQLSNVETKVYMIHGSFFTSSTLTGTAFDGLTEEGSDSLSFDRFDADGFGGDMREMQIVDVFTITDFAGEDTFTMDFGTAELAITGVIVTQVPEPSSTALLGLCGIALILRRRRS